MAWDDALNLDEALRNEDVSHAWDVWSSASEAALADAYQFAGGPVPDRGLVLGRGTFLVRTVRLGGPQVRKARRNFADPQEGGLVVSLWQVLVLCLACWMGPLAVTLLIAWSGSGFACFASILLFGLLRLVVLIVLWRRKSRTWSYSPTFRWCFCDWISVGSCWDGLVLAWVASALQFGWPYATFFKLLFLMIGAARLQLNPCSRGHPVYSIAGCFWLLAAA